MRLLILPAFLFLAACDPEPRVLTVPTSTGPVEIIQPSRPQALNLRNVNFRNIDRKAILEMAADSEFREIIGITPQDYANLSNNLIDILRYIEIQNAIIDYYEKTTSELVDR